MPVNAQCLTVDDGYEHQLVERLVGEGRRFVKPPSYNVPVGQLLAGAILTNAGESPVPMHIARPGGSNRASDRAQDTESDDHDHQVWVWDLALGTMPNLPMSRRGLQTSAG
jgi:hypothetical protein